jgi:cell division protein FtsB
VLEQQATALAADLNEAKTERERWERRVGLLKSDGLDPDMLDEQARSLLGYADPHDLVMPRKPR